MKKYKLLKDISGVKAGTIFGREWFIISVRFDNIKYFEEIVENYKRYRADKNKIYYYIDDFWLILGFIEQSTDADDAHYNSWNYYSTKEEAEKTRDKQLAIVFLNDRITELNKDWKYSKWDRYYKICPYLNTNSFIIEFSSTIPLSILNPMNENTAYTIIKEYPDKLHLLFDN